MSPTRVEEARGFTPGPDQEATPPGGFQGEALALSHFTLIVAVEDDLECTAQPQYAAAGLAVYAHPLALLRQ